MLEDGLLPNQLTAGSKTNLLLRSTSCIHLNCISVWNAEYLKYQSLNFNFYQTSIFRTTYLNSPCLGTLDGEIVDSKITEKLEMRDVLKVHLPLSALKLLTIESWSLRKANLRVSGLCYRAGAKHGLPCTEVILSVVLCVYWPCHCVVPAVNSAGAGTVIRGNCRESALSPRQSLSPHSQWKKWTFHYLTRRSWVVTWRSTTKIIFWKFWHWFFIYNSAFHTGESCSSQGSAVHTKRNVNFGK